MSSLFYFVTVTNIVTVFAKSDNHCGEHHFSNSWVIELHGGLELRKIASLADETGFIHRGQVRLPFIFLLTLNVRCYH